MRTSRLTLSLLGLLLLGSLTPRTSLAQSDDAPTSPPTPGVGDVLEATEGPQHGIDSGLGFSCIDEDCFVEVNLAYTLAISKLALGLWVPLRFRVIDEAPEEDGVMRSQDWEEPGDYVRLLRFVQWSTPRDTVYVRGGELVDVDMGHGTIVSGYHNILDVNHFQWGLNGALNLAPGGVEVLFDNLVDPDLMGLRGYLRPWYFVDPDSYWMNLAVGASLVGDIQAPLALEQQVTGEYVVDDERNLVVAETGATAVFGVDIELQAFTNDLVSLTPYADVNLHLSEGSGFHLGNLANFSFGEHVALNTRLEFRALGEGYEPTYFDSLYEVERLLFRPLDVTGQRRPKLAVVRAIPPEARLGWYGEGTLGLFEMVYLTAGYENYEGPDNASFFARLGLPRVGPVSLAAYYVNQNFDGAGDMFDLDNALLVTEGRATVWGPIYVLAQFSRRFAAQPDGTYEPVDDWAFGGGASFSF
jgi:hypothetical protein